MGQHIPSLGHFVDKKLKLIGNGWFGFAYAWTKLNEPVCLRRNGTN
jgi:hypothetical protein